MKVAAEFVSEIGEQNDPLVSKLLGRTQTPRYDLAQLLMLTASTTEVNRRLRKGSRLRKSPSCTAPNTEGVV